MSLAEERSEEYLERREQLREQTVAFRQEKEQQHNALLEAVAEGEEFETHTYEWVTIGNVDIEVKTWYPGNVIDAFTDIAEGLNVTSAEQAQNPEGLMQDIDIAQLSPTIREIIGVLTEMTNRIRGNGEVVDDTEAIESFWRGFYGQHGDRALDVAAEKVLGPAEENTDREDVIESFPEQGRSQSLRGDSHRRT